MIAPHDLIVIDTHPLVWYLESSPRLSSDASFAFDAIDQGFGVGVIPTIVMAELMHISEKGRTPLGFNEVLARLQNSKNFGVASLDLGILLRLRNLTMFELHDRIIVATAHSFGAGLITNDRVVQQSRVVECVW